MQTSRAERRASDSACFERLRLPALGRRDGGAPLGSLAPSPSVVSSQQRCLYNSGWLMYL
ncbi:MAG TPA: hypothetical protein VFU32_10830 [Ktedonobacterales bacterium]|nr:hypothetical protein [Ktedonobacterales bacterium]